MLSLVSGVTFGRDIPIRRQTIADERGAGFDSVTDNARGCLSRSVRNEKKKCSTSLACYTAKNPLTLYDVSPMVFLSTELVFVYLNGLVGTAELLAAALQVYEHSLPAEHSPFGDLVTTEVMFTFD